MIQASNHFQTKFRVNIKTFCAGEYSCLKVELIFKREFSYYLITIYVPCCMLVIVSWVSFWLDQHAIPARVSLGVTTLLAMSTQTSGISAQLPPVSYTKAIDVWTGACQVTQELSWNYTCKIYLFIEDHFKPFLKDTMISWNFENSIFYNEWITSFSRNS